MEKSKRILFLVYCQTMTIITLITGLSVNVAFSSGLMLFLITSTLIIFWSILELSNWNRIK